MHDYIDSIRNFCIIAHIDHGKSTLADRMLQLTSTIHEREFRDQLLDSMDLERERGITIKSHPVTMRYHTSGGKAYEYNLLDTPGHVDFTYEVSRSMAACEGALLVIDASQGVEAQTVANVYLAIENDLEIIPVLNKTDLPNSNVPEAKRQIEEVLGLSTKHMHIISAKTGDGVPELMAAITSLIPPPAPQLPKGNRALVFDSIYDAYRGVVPYIRLTDGILRAGDRIRFIGTAAVSEIKEIGVFSPKFTPMKMLRAGQVGYIVTTIKEPCDIRVGDTLVTSDSTTAPALPGFKNIQPMVFSGLYPVNTADYEKLKSSMERLALNDSAFTYQAESSVALGFGFRCGFLGLLHLEIVQERLRREYDLDIISTYPAVVYHIYLKNGKMETVDNPVNMPDQTRVDRIEEPIIKAAIICQNEHIGDMMRLIMDRRGSVDKTDSMDTRRVMLSCTIPLNEILVDFYDCLKSISHGYASMDYEYAGYAPGDLVKMDILLNGEPVDAFSSLIHRTRAEYRGRQMCKALKEVIPPHLFVVPIQASINKSVIARETIRALRKDVTAKCYGGDITRKRKLLERQKEGKRRMKLVGKVNVPQEAFVSILKSGL